MNTGEEDEGPQQYWVGGLIKRDEGEARGCAATGGVEQWSTEMA